MKLLDICESEPAIWNPQNKDRNYVQDAWRRLQTQISVECLLKELKRKKECFLLLFIYSLLKTT